MAEAAELDINLTVPAHQPPAAICPRQTKEQGREVEPPKNDRPVNSAVLLSNKRESDEDNRRSFATTEPHHPRTSREFTKAVEAAEYERAKRAVDRKGF